MRKNKKKYLRRDVDMNKQNRRDDQGRITTYFFPNGNIGKYYYSEDNTLCVLCNSEGTLIRQFTVTHDGIIKKQMYNNNGLLSSMCNSDGRVVTLNYDDARKLIYTAVLDENNFIHSNPKNIIVTKSI